MRIVNNYDIRIEPNNERLVKDKVNDATYKGEEFSKLLESALKDQQKVKFSKHAQLRMSERNILLSQNELDMISDAVTKANLKGVKDSLILLDKVAFIVNVPSKTVVTTVDKASIKDNVFTNIDGAVII